MALCVQPLCFHITAEVIYANERRQRAEENTGGRCRFQPWAPWGADPLKFVGTTRCLSRTFTVCCLGEEGRKRLPFKDSDACLIPPDAEMPVWGGFRGKHRDMVPSRGPASHNMAVTEMMINAGFVCLINT